MYDYGEYCPISKAAQIIGERWTLLILRELVSGTTRFNEFRRYLPRLSPTLLNTRLRTLEQQGLILKRRRHGQQGSEYQLTPAGRALEPILYALGHWASRWAYSALSDHELNADVLMRDIQHTLLADKLPAGRVVLLFQFTDLPTSNKWYLVADKGITEVCDEDRALDVDVYVTSELRTLTAVWAGELDLARACADGRLKLSGPPMLLRGFPEWFGRSPFADSIAVEKRLPATGATGES